MEHMHTQSYKEQLHAPFDWYRTMRTTQPVFKSPNWGGWQVFRYADVARVLSEYATFSSDGQRIERAAPVTGEAGPEELARPDRSAGSGLGFQDDDGPARVRQAPWGSRVR